VGVEEYETAVAAAATMAADAKAIMTAAKGSFIVGVWTSAETSVWVERPNVVITKEQRPTFEEKANLRVIVKQDKQRTLLVSK
jgi:hypothetical protein